MFCSLPEHSLVPMPALSPTMESGSIANWLLKEGDAFEAGQAICEVETDKATVTYDATDDGYIAKILAGSGEVQVGAPLMITVENADDVAKFSNYSVESSTSQQQASSSEGKMSSSVPATTKSRVADASSQPSLDTGGRVFASPLAKRMARDAEINLADIAALGVATGPRGRLLGADVTQAISSGALTQSKSPSSTAAVPSMSSTHSQDGDQKDVELFQHNSSGENSSFILNSLFSQSKKQVPHYYLSVEIDLKEVLDLKKIFDDSDQDISVQDILIKAAAKCMEKVPSANASWMDSFVRQYDQVDINLIIGEGSNMQAPLLRNASVKGLSAISNEIRSACEVGDSGSGKSLEVGTFAIHNLGMYGVKATAPIVLPPHACALSFGEIVDTVVPNTTQKEGEEMWKVAPVMVATLSCDHRVIDGAVGASWLKSFKEYTENPLTLLL